MPCENCAELCVEYQIRGPQQLRKAIEITKQNIEDGTIVELQTQSSARPVPFLMIASGAEWDDIVEYKFRCANCGELFSLVAETYHGSGGYWRPDNLENIKAN